MLDELQSAALGEPKPVSLDDPSIVPDTGDTPVQPEATDLQIPRSVWHAMWACYALFFAGLLTAIGTERSGLFMLAISVAYTFMFFGTAAILFELNPPRKKSHFENGIGVLETWSGPMTHSAVAGQILVVPLCIALFGISIAVIAKTVGL
ncbi:MAG: hypothetical protein IPG54_04230 [Sphingomonadales bacterium]|nr:hypothetical protein [Sphingomonadales bacterium]MBK9003024.1 hypothetical protein [Sphingomonadales bacterium]MBK9268271.1 hypothetical protein [Sphingomonadales bacterium]MBP6433988.1 hypothetical protein [Sphingorhabdus sp.]